MALAVGAMPPQLAACGGKRPHCPPPPGPPPPPPPPRFLPAYIYNIIYMIVTSYSCSCSYTECNSVVLLMIFRPMYKGGCVTVMSHLERDVYTTTGCHSVAHSYSRLLICSLITGQTVAYAHRFALLEM